MGFRINIFYFVSFLVWTGLVFGSPFIPAMLVAGAPALLLYWLAGMAAFGILMGLGLRHGR